MSAPIPAPSTTPQDRASRELDSALDGSRSRASATDWAGERERSGDPRTFGALVAAASNDLGAIVRGEVELAKHEISSAVATGGKGAGMLAGAAVFGLFGLGFLLTAAAWGLVAAGLATWLAFLIVAVVLLIVTGILALVGKNALQHVKPAPEKAIAEAQRTIETLKQSI